MQVTTKGSIRNRQLNRQSILEHNHTVRGTAFSSASRPVCRWGVVSSHKVRRHYDKARTSRRTATLRPQYKRANDPRYPVCPASERPATQSARNQCLGRRTRVSHSKTPTECTVHDVLSVLCNAVVIREATHACVSVVGVHRSVTTYRIIDNQPNFSRKLLCVHLSKFLDESPPASSITQLVTTLSTQPV